MTGDGNFSLRVLNFDKRFFKTMQWLISINQFKKK